jgi:tetratricopeptide (TPR) repeat protein
MQVTKAAALNCKDQNSIPYSNLCINIAAIYEEKGRSLTAQTYNEQALKIRRTLLPHGHSEIANALSNYAHSIICAGGNMSTALGYLHEALEINMLNPKEDRQGPAS